MRKRKVSKEYERARRKYRVQKTLLDQPHTKETVQAFKAAQQNLLQTPYYPQADLGYKSLQFNRYADDFVVGIIGSREDAERVKADIRGFLVDELKLTLSEEKTKITHSSELINYLGYQFTVRRSRDTKRDENGILRRMWYGKVALYVPHDKWVQKLKEYQAFKIVTSNDGKERWKPLHRGKLMHKDAIAIISQFNAEIRGLYSYYCLVENVSVLINFYLEGRLKDLKGKDELELKMMQMWRRSIALCPECFA